MSEPDDDSRAAGAADGADADEESDLGTEMAAGELIGGRYQIVRLLGQGGMGRVYEATHATLGRPVAIKVLRGDLSLNAAYRARFEREARVSSRLSHENAVQVHDFGEHEGLLYLVMEMLTGRELRELCDFGLPPLPWARAVAIAERVADVLTVAHEIQLVHRDLKPENLMLAPATGPGSPARVVVVDFGLAFIAGAEGPGMGRLTRTGLVAGTPNYLSPEQARGERVGPPSDIYSLGCVLYEMLAGEPPFVANAPAEVLSMHLYMPVPEVRAKAPDTPDALAALVSEMLSKDAARRPPAAEVLRRLQALAATGDVRASNLARTRESRMVPASPAQPSILEPQVLAPGVTEVVALLGVEPQRGLTVACAANGLALMLARDEAALDGPDARGVVAIFAPDADAETVARLAQRGVPVLAAGVKGDMERIVELLRAGAAEVVPSPVTPETLVPKLVRAVKTARRRRRPGGTQ